jgi:hypothetical protein
MMYVQIFESGTASRDPLFPSNCQTNIPQVDDDVANEDVDRPSARIIRGTYTC